MIVIVFVIIVIVTIVSNTAIFLHSAELSLVTVLVKKFINIKYIFDIFGNL